MTNLIVTKATYLLIRILFVGINVLFIGAEIHNFGHPIKWEWGVFSLWGIFDLWGAFYLEDYSFCSCV